MPKKTTVEKLNKPATVIIKFGGDKVKVKFPRLSELFSQLKDGSYLEKEMIVTTRKQLGY